MKKTFSDRIRSLGPGLITAALVFGPGSLTITTKLGAGFGFNLLWVIPVAIVFMISYTKMTARIGLKSKVSLMEIIRNRYGKIGASLLGISIFIITASFQAGNSIGAGVAFAELLGTSTPPWVLFFSLAAIILLFFRSFYKILEKIMIGMVLVMFISFLVTLLLSRPNLALIALGFVPTLPSGSELLTVALVASSFSVVAAFYQSYLVQEKGWKMDEFETATAESRNGIIVLGLLSGMIIICSSAVLHQQNIAVNTASDLGLALEPLFGKFATIAFMIGFFAASFSSLIGNATIGGAILADAFSQGKMLSSWTVRIFIICVIIIGAGVALYFGASPLKLIIFAQAFTLTIAPIAAVFILIIANDRSIMGNSANTRYQNILPIIGLGVLIFLAGYNISNFF